MVAQTSTFPFRVVGRVLLVLLLLFVLLQYRANAKQLHRRSTAAEHTQVVAGLPLIPRLLPETPKFVSLARAHMPKGASYRFIRGDKNFCVDSDRTAIFWVTYQLLPRQVQCKGPVSWLVLYDSSVRPPAGSTVVDEVGRLKLVHLNTATGQQT